MKASEALSIGSSIATLTGVSFTWLATLGDFKNASAGVVFFKGTIAIIAGLLLIGISYGLVQLFISLRNETKPQHHVYVWTFGLATCIFIASFLIGMVWMVAYFLWTIRS